MSAETFAPYRGQDRPQEECSNYGLVWTTQEKEYLEELYRKGLSLYKICEELGRPRSGVLKKLADARLISVNPTGTHFLCRVPQQPRVTQPTTQPTTQPEKSKMNKTAIALEVKTFVFGAEVKDLSDADLITALKELANKVKDLKAIGVNSKMLQKMTAQAEADMAAVVEILDSRA